MNYQLIAESAYILRIADNGSVATIPDDNGNTDWLEYQAWLALGNTPLPAE